MGGRLSLAGRTSLRASAGAAGSGERVMVLAGDAASVGSMLQCWVQSQCLPSSQDEAGGCGCLAASCMPPSPWQQAWSVSMSAPAAVAAGIAIAVADHTDPTAPAIRDRHSSRGSRIRSTRSRQGYQSANRTTARRGTSLPAAGAPAHSRIGFSFH